MRIDMLRGLPREVGVLTAVAFTVALGFGILAPALPVFAHDFGVGETAAAAVISAFAFMRFASALAGGRLVHKIGERLLLAAGIGIVAVSTGLAGLSQSYTQLLVLRGIGGVGSAMFTLSAVNLLIRTVDPGQRGRATGVYQSGFIIGGISGPTLGGMLTAVWIRAPFFVYAVLLAVAGSIGMVFLSRARLADDTSSGTTTRDQAGHGGPAKATGKSDDHGADRSTEGASLRTALRDSAYRAALVANLGTGWAVFGVRSALIPLFVVEALRQKPLWTGVGFAVASGVQALTMLLSGPLADKRGRRPAMVTGAALACASMITLVLPSSLPLYITAMGLLGAGASFLGVATGAVVGDVASGRSGNVVAVYQMSRDFGTIVGPLAAGALAQYLSYGAAFGVSAVILAVTAGLAFTARETHLPARRHDAHG